MSWKDFEKECYDYLCKKYGAVGARFDKLGEGDSTKPDILVSVSADEEYYIEVKEPKAQCGQFVLFPNDSIEAFEYSPKNKSPLDKYSQEMIAYMNRFYKEYREAGTKGKDIPLESVIFVKWIVNYYRNKGVKFFITKGIHGFIIFPIEKFSQYFNVAAKYREKKSGSTNPKTKDLQAIKQALYNNSVEQYKIETEGKKTYVRTEVNIERLKSIVGEYTYYFKKYSDGKYAVTRLSNTRNSNVIFSIKLMKEQDSEDLKLFENSL